MSFTWGELEHMQSRREWRLPLPPTCPRCDYELTGLPEDRCPECGTEFRWEEVRKRTSRIWTLVLRMQHANKDAELGIMVGAAGWFGLLFFRFVALTGFLPLMRVVAFGMALICIILGSQVLNIRRVPKWARPYACNPPPNMPLGAGAMFLGFSQLLGTLFL